MLHRRPGRHINNRGLVCIRHLRKKERAGATTLGAAGGKDDLWHKSPLRRIGSDGCAECRIKLRQLTACERSGGHGEKSSEARDFETGARLMQEHHVV